MSTIPLPADVIIGYDGKPRCAWAGAGDTALGRYHDEVWGTRTYDEPAMFEALTLGVFRGRPELVNRIRQAGRVPDGIPRLRRCRSRRDDRAGCRPAEGGRLDHPQPWQDPGDRRQCARD